MKRHKDDEGPCQFTDEVTDPVKDALLSTTGAKLVPFDHIREQGVGQGICSRDADPGQRAGAGVDDLLGLFLGLSLLLVLGERGVRVRVDRGLVGVAVVDTVVPRAPEPRR